ncbi:hypothetical protein PIB30_089753 [Stylosanthes scabra]|uniref:Uncharacterized protein n=1 Tax=Stylosanthes scabra TaxID=79078 RepID=A0ABU6SUW5_9FABA|nr:hypothetical protein [Stylosanthes scabra]
MIAPETGAKVTRSSPTFKIRKGNAESTQKGGTSCFGVAVTFARKEPYLGFIQSSCRVREDNRRVSSRPALGNLGMHHDLFAHFACICLVFIRQKMTLGPIRVRSGRATRMKTLGSDDELRAIKARCDHPIGAPSRGII